MKDLDYKEALKYIYFEVLAELKKKEQELNSEYRHSREWKPDEEQAYLLGMVYGAKEARELFESIMERMYRKEQE